MTRRSSQRKRWKRVEVRVAEILSEIFSDIGIDPVVRIPLLGRTGPDISFNEVELIVDGKSRREVPKGCLAVKGQALRLCDMLGFQLEDLPNLASLSPFTASPSRLVAMWMSHMHEWKVNNVPTGITCVILHRPHMPVGQSTVIIYAKERNALCQRLA
jgi:hypothetical protein